MKIGIAVRQSLFICIIKIQVSKYAFTALICISCYNYAYHDFWKQKYFFSESLEQLASYNGADMHKYNRIYT